MRSQEGELPLELLLARYGYGGGPSDEKGELSSDSSDSDFKVDSALFDPPVRSVTSDGAGPSRINPTDNKLTTNNTNNIDSNEVPPTDSQTQANSSSKDEEQPSGNHSLDKEDANVNPDSELEAKKNKSSLLGKRRGDPVVNDAMLSSKRAALMSDTNEGS